MVFKTGSSKLVPEFPKSRGAGSELMRMFPVRLDIVYRDIMDDFDFGFGGDEVADALMAGVDFNQLTEGWVLGTLLESPENIRELLVGKSFPMGKAEVESLYVELLSDEIITEKYLIRDLPEGEYSEDHIIEMLTTTFTRILEEEH